MSKYARRRKKEGVAQRATVDQLSRKFPPPNGLKSLTSIKDVFRLRRYSPEVSWRVIAWELGISDRGTLSRVAKGDREPTEKLCSKINSAYGCNVRPHPKHVAVEPCAKCGQLHEFKSRCPSAPRQKRRTYDISYKRLRELLQSPYLMS